jgi:hypothetical protein
MQFRKAWIIPGWVAVLAGSGMNAWAVPDPQVARDATPEVLVCCMTDVVAEEGDEVSRYSASCRVLEVIRSTVEAQPGDILNIAYEVHHAAFEKEHPTMPGPAFPTPPPPLHEGDTVTAWMRRVSKAVGEAVYLPNIGMDSFETVRVEDGREPAHCGKPEPAPP